MHVALRGPSISHEHSKWVFDKSWKCSPELCNHFSKLTSLGCWKSIEQAHTYWHQKRPTSSFNSPSPMFDGCRAKQVGLYRMDCVRVHRIIKDCRPLCGVRAPNVAQHRLDLFKYWRPDKSIARMRIRSRVVTQLRVAIGWCWCVVRGSARSVRFAVKWIIVWKYANAGDVSRSSIYLCYIWQSIADYYV